MKCEHADVVLSPQFYLANNLPTDSQLLSMNDSDVN